MKRVEFGVESAKCGVGNFELCGVQSEVCLWGVHNVKCKVECAQRRVQSVKSESKVWSVECRVCSVKCRVWSAKCEVWNVMCKVQSAECKKGV